MSDGVAEEGVETTQLDVVNDVQFHPFGCVFDAVPPGPLINQPVPVPPCCEQGTVPDVPCPISTVAIVLKLLP